MKALPRVSGALPALFLSALLALRATAAEIKPSIGHLGNDATSTTFNLPGIDAPVQDDAAKNATFSVIDGEVDGNGGGLAKLHDGAIPGEADDPAHNFFFRGPEGGRLLIELPQVTDVARVSTYSWHPGARGPQVYKLYASDGTAPGFVAKPKRPLDPATAGWKLIGTADSRQADGKNGGQFGVTWKSGEQGLGKYRYLLLDVVPTFGQDVNSNTFFSEIDVIDRAAPAPKVQARSTQETIEIAGGKYRCIVDVSETPELKEWVHQKLLPAVVIWYPKIVELLPSEGYTAPKRFSITFKRDMAGVAYTAGTSVVCAYPWYAKNLEGEGVGSVIHELVHVAQQYRGGRPPGWCIEGIPDYVRWYLYEPQSHGADIRPAAAAKARYDASYRTTANFLNWVSTKYDAALVAKLNAACRRGKYDEGLWREWAGHTLTELGEEWKAALTAGK